MSSARNSSSDKRFEQLLSQVVDGEMSDSAHAELVEILRESEVAKVRYLEYLSIHSSLDLYWGTEGIAPSDNESQVGQEEVGVSAGAPSNSSSVLSTFSGSSLFSARAFSVAVATLLAANLIFLLWSEGRNRFGLRDESVQIASTEASDTFPQLVSMTACVWQPSADDIPAVGQRMEHGKVLSLIEGIAELQVSDSINCNARVRIEGPASVYVHSDGQLGLSDGFMTADITCRDGQFVIDTPLGNVVVDSTASIGVSVNENVNEVHVFDGEAQIDANWSTYSDSLLLIQGEAVTLAKLADEGGLDVTRLEASSSQFASRRSMAFDRLSLNGAYRDAVLASKPDIYWRFEDGARQVSSETQTDDADKQFSVEVEGDISWRQSGENRAAEFGLTPEGGMLLCNDLWPEKPLESYAVEFWIKPSHFHNGALFGMMRPGENGGKMTHGMFVEIGGPYHSSGHQTPRNAFRFVHRATPSNDTWAGTSCKSDCKYQVRIWQHIVANKTKDSVELFVDGELVNSIPDSTSLSTGMKVLIGQLAQDQNEVRPFIGQMDEVAVYGRSLTIEEIRKHFETARPPKGRSDEEQNKSAQRDAT